MHFSDPAGMRVAIAVASQVIEEVATIPVTVVAVETTIKTIVEDTITSRTIAEVTMDSLRM